MSKATNSPKAKPKKAALGRGLAGLFGDNNSMVEDEDISPKPFVTPTPRKPALGKSVPKESAAPKAAETTTETTTEKPVATAPELAPASPVTPAATPKIPAEARIWQIDIEKLQGNPNQPRKVFEAEELTGLADSIKQKGILQPIVVRKKSDNNFEIIAGERRWRAAQQAGLHRVPVILKTVTDQNALELALIENIQREDLNVIEEARAYRHLMDEYLLTQQQLAEKMGKERVTIANVLRLLKLEPSVQEMVANQQVSLGQAKVLLSIDDYKTQRRIARKVKDDKLTVRATERLVQKWNQKHSEEGTAASISSLDVSKKMAMGLGEELQKLMGTKVSVDYSNAKGKVSVHFYSDDELNQLVERLRQSWQN